MIETKETTIKASEHIKNMNDMFNKIPLKKRIVFSFFRLCLKLSLLKPVRFGVYKWFWVK